MAATPIPPILDQDRYVRYEPVAPTTDFDVPFPYFGTDASELLVLVGGVKVSTFTVVSRSAGALANAVLPVEDAVVRLGSSVSGVVVEVYGSIRPRRTVQATAAFGTRDFNFVFSYLIAALREMWSQFTRAVQVPPGESAVILPAAAERAGKVLAFGADGTPRVADPANAGLVGTSSLLDGAVTLAKWATDAVAALAAKQPAAGTLTLLAGLVPAPGTIPHFVGSGAVSLVSTGAAGLDVLSKGTMAEILALLGVGSGFLNAQLITASGNITKTAGAKKWLYFVQGAGAGGVELGGQWGAAGALAIGVLDVSAVSTVPCIVGSGGGWGGNSTNYHNGGGQTSLNGTIIANGGTGGSNPTTATASGGLVNIEGAPPHRPADTFFGHAPTVGGVTRAGTGYGAGGGPNGTVGAGRPGCILILEFA